MLSKKEQSIRIEKVQKIMVEQNIDALFIASSVNTLYLFGEVFVGCTIVPQSGEAQFFIRRPQKHNESSNIHFIRKIEQVKDFIDISKYKNIGFELDELPYNEIIRQKNIFEPIETIANATNICRLARMIKTDEEIRQIRHTAKIHNEVYNKIPALYRKGMTDLEFQIEIERLMRQNGSIGLFRAFGSVMEIFMGSLISGNNALAPSPYDFAMGGEGNEALPLGSNGSKMLQGNSVMIDMAGNYGMYMSDMTRTYSIGELPKEAYRLHELSCKMHYDIMQKAKIGDSCADIYNKCIEMAKENNAENCFMGLDQKAPFVGHSLGLQINELPVLTSRSKDKLQKNMVIAFEPKFVLPDCGAVGIENTYLIKENGVENLTSREDNIIDLTCINNIQRNEY